MRKLSAALLVMVLLNPSAAFCKSKSEEKKSSNKSGSTVDQIIDAVEAEKLTDEERAAQTKKRNERIDHVIDTIAEKANMGEEEKAKLKAKIAESREKQSQLPAEVKEKMDGLFQNKEFCKDTTNKVISDHFTDTDQKALLKFLKSPTGKKLIKEAPDMLAQSLELAAIHYLPIFMDMVKTLRMPGMQGLPGMPGFGGPSMPPGFTPPPGIGPRGIPNMSPEQQKQMMEKIKELLKDSMPKQHTPPPGPGKDET